MKYSRLLRLFPLLLAWEGIVWIVCNGHLLREQIWILYDKQQIYEEFYIRSSFYNVGPYMLVLSITSVMAMEYCLREERIPILVRCQSRVAFLRKRWRTITGVSLMYVLLHFTLGYGLSFFLFPEAFVQSRQTGLFYVASAPLLFLFFLRTNVIYVLLRDFFPKKIFAMAGILALCLFAYYVGYFVIADVWMPCKDVDMGLLAYSYNLGCLEFALALVRQSGVTVIIAILSLKYFDRKDVIEIEK